MKQDNSVEKLSADILLKKGINLSFMMPFLGIFKRRRHFVLTAPSLETLLKVARLYLSIPPIEESISTPKAMEMVALHGKTISLILAVVLRGGKEGILTRQLAKTLRKNLTQQEIFYLFQLVALHGGVQDFIATIRYIGTHRITAPMLSQEAETS